MGLPPWETSDSQLFALVTGVNSGLGFSIASRMIDEFFTSPSTPANKHLVLILCTRTPIKTRFTISRLRAHLRKLIDYSPWAAQQRKIAKAQGKEYSWEAMAQRVHFLGVEADLCDLKSVYALADKLVNGVVGSPDAVTMDGHRLPHGSPGTASYSADVKQDRWALSQEQGSSGVDRSWGWGLSGIRVPRLDVIVLSAGVGGWLGVNFLQATRDVLFDFIEALTWPAYKLANVGAVVRSQKSYGTVETSDEAKQPLLDNQEKAVEPPLGEVFCANVFGHYILAHELMPLLSRPATPSSKTGGKIIWVSTIEALQEGFSLEDIQGIKSLTPYENTKRVIDIMTLTSDLPSTQRASASFFDSKKSVTASKKRSNEEDKAPLVRPRMYLSHPGIFVSEILPLPGILVSIYTMLFYFARWLGSPWHPIVPYKAAVAPVWLSLIDPVELEEKEGNGAAKCKYGSATDTSGAERVMKTEVPGWGWNGQVEVTDEERRKGRKRNAIDATKESREEFEEQGVKVWKSMEGLRQEWEDILEVRN